jgi:hypothetical protein
VITYIALGFPFALLILFLLGMPNVPYEMDHGQGSKPGTFFPVLILYHVFFYVIFTVDVLMRAKTSLFTISAIEAWLFNGAIVFFYESYLHQRYPMRSEGTSNYSLLRYAIVLSLGVSAAVTFVAGLIGSAGK